MALCDRDHYRNPFFFVILVVLLVVFYAFRMPIYEWADGIVGAYFSKENIKSIMSFAFSSPDAGLLNLLVRAILGIIVGFLLIGLVFAVWILHIGWKLYVTQLVYAYYGAHFLTLTVWPLVETMFISASSTSAEVRHRRRRRGSQATVQKGVVYMPSDERDDEQREKRNFMPRVPHFQPPAIPEDFKDASVSVWRTFFIERQLKRYKSMLELARDSNVALTDTKKAAVEGLRSEIDFQRLYNELTYLEDELRHQRKKTEVERELYMKQMEMKLRQIDTTMGRFQKEMGARNKLSPNDHSFEAEYRRRLAERLERGRVRAKVEKELQGIEDPVEREQALREMRNLDAEDNQEEW